MELRSCNNHSLVKYVQITDTYDGVRMPKRLYDNYIRNQLSEELLGEIILDGDYVYIPSLSSDTVLELQISAYDAKNWYEALEKYTFKSVFIPLNGDQIELILDYSRDKNVINTPLGKKFLADLQKAFDQICPPESNTIQKIFVKLDSVCLKTYGMVIQMRILLTDRNMSFKC